MNTLTMAESDRRVDELVDAMAGLNAANMPLDMHPPYTLTREQITGTLWRIKRVTGVAVVLTNAKDAGYRLEGQRNENERRAMMTPGVCARVLMAYSESRYQFAEMLAKGLGAPRFVQTLLAECIHPSYTEMRNFLIGEYDADPIIASAAALWRTQYNNKSIRQGFFGRAQEAWHGGDVGRGETGWL